MDDFEVEAKVYEYMVYVYLLKALDRDGAKLASLKLARFWNQVLERLIARLTKDLTALRNQMRQHGCRIVLEEMTSGNIVHVMYIYRRYEHHCYMLPYVLKARCEDKLLALLPDMLPDMLNVHNSL